MAEPPGSIPPPEPSRQSGGTAGWGAAAHLDTSRLADARESLLDTLRWQRGGLVVGVGIGVVGTLLIVWAIRRVRRGR